MALTTTTYTVEDLLRMPGDEPWELWDGELRRVPGSGEGASGVAAQLLVSIGIYLRSNDLGHVTGADGSYVLSRAPDTVVVPDVAFVRWDSRPEDQPVSERYAPIRPDLAIEVQSPHDEPGKMAEKRALYARARVPLLWWVNPGNRTVSVYRLGEAPVVLTEADTLDGEDVLPGLMIPVAEVFPRWR